MNKINNHSYKEVTDIMNENSFFKAVKCLYFFRGKKEDWLLIFVTVS